MSAKFETTIPFHNHKRRAKTPSFSSILLDSMYRSMDEDHHGHYSQTTPTSPTHIIIKQRDCEIDASQLVQRRRTKMRSDTFETVDLRRAIMIESWMEKQPHQHQPLPQQQKNHFHLGDVLDQNKVRIIRQKSVPNQASVPDNNDTLSSSSCFTNLAPRASRDQSSSRIFTKTKSRALKIYGELKKSKNQNTPISPRRRIAAFLNSIFRNNTSNSPARTSPDDPPPLAAATMTTSNSTCSTASSFSRSCLSNKTSSSGKSTPATTKRSVRFYPVSVILDEDSRPCGHKSLHKSENEEFKKLVSPRPVNGDGGMEQQKWRREKEIDALMMMIKANCGDNGRRNVSSLNAGEMDEDDNGSCASSDLFELENLSSIGVVSRYYEELPVYGTTSLKNITS